MNEIENLKKKKTYTLISKYFFLNIYILMSKISLILFFNATLKLYYIFY